MISRSQKLQLAAATGLSIAIIVSVTYYIYLYRRRRKSAANSLRHCSSSNGDFDRLSDHECNNLWIVDDTESSGECLCSPETLINFQIASDLATTESGNENTSSNLPFEHGSCETVLETCVLRRPPALSAELCSEEAVRYSSKEVVILKRKLSMECTSVGDIAADIDESSTAASSANRGLPPRPFRRRKMIALISNIVKSQQSNRLDERTALSLVKLLNDHEHNVILQCLAALKTVSSSTENQSCIPQLIQLLDYHIRSRRFRDACLQALLKLADDIPDGNLKHSEMLICSLLHVYASHPDLTRFLVSKNGALVLNFLMLLDRLVQTMKNLPNGGVDALHDPG
ncbi:hypothetical protein M514_00010 [Trichuris suis]|uniref:Armadillo repeat-containing domain-containing protein n=1 Tax=Trichuris suis TaxID=68888 RepID=A0A085NTR1_9BILA|nr:hypothetical protein M514_00010 [Trichuris suis]